MEGVWTERNQRGKVDFSELKIKFLMSAKVTGSNEEKTGAG